MSNNKKVAIDVDGVVFPYTDVMKAGICRLYGVCNLPDPLHHREARDWVDGGYLTEEDLTRARKVLFDADHQGQETHNNCQPCQGSRRSLKKLNQLGWKIYFLTARGSDRNLNQHSASELIKLTSNWLNKHFPYAEDIIYSKQKEKYAGKFACLLDDRGVYCRKWIKAGGKAILYKRSHNQQHHQTDLPLFKGWLKDSLLNYIT